MRIGIDISQTAYENTGVANYLRHLVEGMVAIDSEDEFVFFFSSLRRRAPAYARELASKYSKRVKIKEFKFPPLFLDFMWNRMHVLPVEDLIGDIDLFITSDWTEPPTKNAKKATILYDLIVYKFPKETAQSIVSTQKRKLAWTKKESDVVLCISEATKKDAMEILGMRVKNLK